MEKQITNAVPIGNSCIGGNHPVYFIAEIGNNHNGDFYLAKRTIEQAALSGANAVKFQKRYMDEVFTKEMQDQPQEKDQIFGKTYGEYRRHLELNKGDYRKLKKVAEGLGLTFFATPFDKKSVDFLEDVGVAVYKIASFDATNTPLLEYVASKGKPVILSLGMATLEETDLAIETILRQNSKLVLMHCVSVYPTPDDRLNLSTISFLKERYPAIPVGYSGHEKDILPSVASTMLGAQCIERHFTLDKLLPGPDHSTVSLDPKEFRLMVEDVRRLEKGMGIAHKQLFLEENKTRAKHSKSIVSKCIIAAGTLITEDMITFKSPGHGFKPYEIDQVVGKKSLVQIMEDVVITRDLIA